MSKIRIPSRSLVLLTALAVGAGSGLWLGCTPKVTKRSKGGAATARADGITFVLPDKDAFSLADGDVDELLESFWYTLTPTDEACGGQEIKANEPYEQGDEVTVAGLASACAYDVTVALGKGKKAYYKAEESEAEASAALALAFVRTSAGKTAGFKEESVDVESPSDDDEADDETDDTDDTDEDGKDEDAAVTYAAVKPLLDKSCISCHAKSGSRPQSDLTTYVGAKSFAELLADYVASGRMPPPPAKLDADAKALIQKWKDGGYLEKAGDDKDDKDDKDEGEEDTVGGGSQPNRDPNIVEFRIPAGTGRNAWNTKATEIVAKVGQTVRIYNDDSRVHQLHTNGAPCGHGNAIQPGSSGDCVVTQPYSGTPLYDHGTDGQVFIRAER
jgi:hypothetical protein